MRRSIPSSLWAVFLVILFSCNSQKTDNSDTEKDQPDQSIPEKIDEMIGVFNYNEGFMGSVLVAHKGKVVFKKSYGYANREWTIPNTLDTKFRIASVTKPFTAILVLQLVEANKIALHDPITRYLKDYPKQTGDQITIHHLLTHTSGLVRNIDINEKEFHSPAQLVDAFKNEPLQFPPGEQFSYSNAGYVLLGHLMEEITGKSYAEILKEQILEPLKMENSGYFRHRIIVGKRSSGYQNNFIDYNNANYFDYSNAYAAGGIYSTVEDLLCFDQALYNEVLLSEKTLKLAFSKHIADKHYGGFYGYGWEIIEKSIGNSNEKIETISHTGALPDYCAIFTRIPSSKTTIILLSNKGRSFLNTITKNVTAILMNKSFDFPKKSAAKQLLEEIEKGDTSNLHNFFQKLKNDTTSYISENEMNILSYKYLEKNQPHIAQQILKIAIEYFPGSFNLYDSYGEVLLYLGEKESAIKNYKKSIELNANNKHGIKVLEELGVK